MPNDEITLSVAKNYIQKYININNDVTINLENHIQNVASVTPETKKFFKAINEANTFVFDASHIKRFFTNPDDQPDYFIICLGGNVNSNPGEATVLTAGCKKVGNTYTVLKSLVNPVSEHPGRFLLPTGDITQNFENLHGEELAFLKEPE